MKLSLFSTLISLTLAGCATPRTAIIDGKTVPRPTLGYTDHDLYAIEHRAAWPTPRGASSGLHGFGGHLWGRVCGNDVQLDAEYRGRYLDVSGFVSPAIAKSANILPNDKPVHFEARDRHGRREVIGLVGEPALRHPLGPPVVDFKYSPDKLEGQIGWRHFKLRREGDQYVGTVNEVGEISPFVVDGVDELWLMPAPDQVALLPFMMTCAYEHAFMRGAAPPDAAVPISFRDKADR
jgi:hypothetical protein